MHQFIQSQQQGYYVSRDSILSQQMSNNRNRKQDLKPHEKIYKHANKDSSKTTPNKQTIRLYPYQR